MAHLLIAATPLPGHVGPMLGAAATLIAAGHSVTFTTGSTFRARVEAAGARFEPLPDAVDIDHRRLEELFPELATLDKGAGQMVFGVQHFFADTIPPTCAALRRLIETEAPACLLIDTAFSGALPLLLGPADARPPIVALGITALALGSADTGFFGSGLPPARTAAQRARYATMRAYMERTVFGDMQAYLDRALATIEAPPLPCFISDALVTLPDLYLQLTAPSFEYPRSDLPESVRFIGRLPPPDATGFEPPAWWDAMAEAIAGGRKLVVVTQGTLANTDLTELLIPGLRALAGQEDLVVVAVTGGPDPAPLAAEAGPNTHVAKNIPFDHLLPLASALVTNGGYGAVNHALSLGVPLVVAGGTEEKPEIARRIAWSGAGIDLATGRARKADILAAVRAVLDEPDFRDAAVALAADFARFDAAGALREAVEATITAHAA